MKSFKQSICALDLEEFQYNKKLYELIIKQQG